MECDNTDCTYFGTQGCKLLDRDYPGYGQPCQFVEYQGEAASADDVGDMLK